MQTEEALRAASWTEGRGEFLHRRRRPNSRPKDAKEKENRRESSHFG